MSYRADLTSRENLQLNASYQRIRIVIDVYIYIFFFFLIPVVLAEVKSCEMRSN